MAKYLKHKEGNINKNYITETDTVVVQNGNETLDKSLDRLVIPVEELCGRDKLKKFATRLQGKSLYDITIDIENAVFDHTNNILTKSNSVINAFDTNGINSNLKPPNISHAGKNMKYSNGTINTNMLMTGRELDIKILNNDKTKYSIEVDLRT